MTAADGALKCDKKGNQMLATVTVPQISTECERIFSNQGKESWKIHVIEH